ncbi:MAG: lipoyl(octanoyl) transferase LipB [Planctomycetota bacterium]
MLRTKSPQFESLQNSVLNVYLLPETPWEETVLLQQRLVYELSEAPRRRAALVLCEHPPVITVGRQGSRQHIRLDDDELKSRRWSVRWTNRGGGCWLQIPGQLAAYCIMPLDPSGLGLASYRDGLYQTMLNVLDEFKIHAERHPRLSGVWVGGREIGSVGVAVKNWIAYHGCRLNVCVPLDPFEKVQSNPASSPDANRAMTCMFRELRAPVRLDAARESFVRHFTSVFGFKDCYLLNAPPFPRSSKRKADVAFGKR